MLSQRDIEAFVSNYNYDLRVTGNGRWIDQKCTPDVLWSISDFVLNYVDNVNDTFTVSDIWHSEYARETIAETFSKPGTDEDTARSEYDKVFAQPLNLLCYAGVIDDIGRGTRHQYVVADRDVLEYIARNDVFSLRFLQTYIEKVLSDSGLLGCFYDFFDNQDVEHFNWLKDSFIDFYHRYTNIRGEYEPRRIFPKVLNPLAFKYSKCGAERGTISDYVITRADMMYNRDNFRDVYRDKPKGITRQAWLAMHPEFDVREGYFEQLMNRNKRLLRDFNDESREGYSEWTQFIEGEDDDTNATQIHHIFPRNEYPEIMHLLENLIALTPNQHFLGAHPNNNTRIIDYDVQKVLLIAKTCSIEQNLETEEPIYSFENLLYVLRIGWDDESVMDIEENDYAEVVHTICYHYA